MIRWYALGLILLACSEPEATGQPAFQNLDWCSYHRCEVAGVRTLNAEPDILPIAKAEAKRWSDATGLQFFFEGEGTKVRFEDQVWWEDPDDPSESWLICARTLFTWGPAGQVQVDAIEVARVPPDGCPSAQQSLLHELGHALDGNTEHATRGVMALTGSDNGLDDAALTLVCSYAPCTKFQPERYLRAVQ